MQENRRGLRHDTSSRVRSALLAVLLIGGCGSKSEQTSAPSVQDASPAATLPADAQDSNRTPLSAQTMDTDATSLTRANPASEHCIAHGGKLRIEKNPAGDEYGVCIFEDNRQCEEWALLRGECRAGGVRITGYVTDAARYCAITGGTYTVMSDALATPERGTCSFSSGRRCDADDYYSGACSKA